jgi:putative Ca2+/H+ antiporter (TMEM165/GDT1 family)
MNVKDALLSTGFDLQLFITTFGIIFLAELPDKTALTAVMLATRHHPLAVFFGVGLAFVVQSLVAILFGSLLGMLPEQFVKIAAGVLFLFFAYQMWNKKEESEEVDQDGKPKKTSFLGATWSSFLVIFIAEWGDLTQLGTAALEAKYKSPITIFSASVLALWAVTGIAVVVGQHVKRLIHPDTLQKAAAVAFAAIGVVILVRTGIH